MTRVLVCGGRDFAAKEHEMLTMLGELTAMHMLYRFTAVINGGAKGADHGAREWGRIAGVTVETFHAQWWLYGKSAGPKRNQRMIDEGKPDLVIAFPGGRGTEDMKRRARTAGIRVIEVLPHTQEKE